MNGDEKTPQLRFVPEENNGREPRPLDEGHVKRAMAQLDQCWMGSNDPQQSELVMASFVDMARREGFTTTEIIEGTHRMEVKRGGLFTISFPKAKK